MCGVSVCASRKEKERVTQTVIPISCSQPLELLAESRTPRPIRPFMHSKAKSKECAEDTPPGLDSRTPVKAMNAICLL